MRRVAFLRTLVLLASCGGVARAEGAAPAQALFDDGKRLMEAHEYADACKRFEESQRLDPGEGTLFHLADCEEQLGKTATAWADFVELASDAHTRGESAREAAAHARAAALEPTLAKLTVDPGASKDAPGFAITRDGAALGPGQWAVAVPLDPGSYVIEAHAQNKQSWTARVEVAAGAAEVVTIPPLVDAAEPLTSTTTTTSAEIGAPRTGNGQRAVGVVLGIAGLAGLGVGGYFGAVSWVRHDDAQSHCGASGCDPTGVSLRSEAVQAGNEATIALIAGGTVLVGAVITFATAPRESRLASSRSRLDVAVGPGSAMLTGTW